MSELTVGTLSGLAANSYVIDVASGSSLDLSNGATLPAGSIVQVVQAETSTAAAITATSPQDIGLSATITPSSASNKILVMTSVYVDSRRASTQTSAMLEIQRDASSIFLDGGDGSIFMNAATASSLVILATRINVDYLDSPATTSSVTYNLRGRVGVGGTAEFQKNSNKSFLTLMEVVA